MSFPAIHGFWVLIGELLLVKDAFNKVQLVLDKFLLFSLNLILYGGNDSPGLLGSVVLNQKKQIFKSPLLFVKMT